MPGYYDRLYPDEPGWESGDDRRCSIMAMHYVGKGALKHSVQGAREMKKRRRMVEIDLKAFGLQILPDHTKQIKTLD